MLGFDDWNASRRGRSHKPVRCTVDANDVWPKCGKPVLDVILDQIDDWDRVEAKRVSRLFVGARPGACASTVSSPCVGNF